MSKIAFVCVLWLLCANAESDEDEKKTKSRNDEVMNTFGELLNSIIKVNEKRIATMKRLTSLQDINLALDALRHGDEDVSSDELEAVLIVIVPNDGNETMSDMYDEAEEHTTIRCDSSDSDSSTEASKKDTSLRAWKSCKKAGAKMCRKACLEAYKSTCEEFSCSKKMKKMFKKQCKSTCKSRFS